MRFLFCPSRGRQRGGRKLARRHRDEHGRSNVSRRVLGVPTAVTPELGVPRGGDDLFIDQKTAEVMTNLRLAHREAVPEVEETIPITRSDEAEKGYKRGGHSSAASPTGRLNVSASGTSHEQGCLLARTLECASRNLRLSRGDRPTDAFRSRTGARGRGHPGSRIKRGALSPDFRNTTVG